MASLSDHELRAITYAMTRKETALAAVRALRGCPDPAAIQALVESIHETNSATIAVEAIDLLQGCNLPIVLDALAAAMRSPFSLVRFRAVEACAERLVPDWADDVFFLLLSDDSWIVRRAAVEALSHQPESIRWEIVFAATDPHWRVRHRLIQVLREWGQDEAIRELILQRLSIPQAEEDQVHHGSACREGVRQYLLHHWSKDRESALIPTANAATPQWQSHPLPACWDWDVAVLLRKLDEFGSDGRKVEVASMPLLLRHSDERVRSIALETLRKFGEPKHLADAFQLFGEPRFEAGTSLVRLWQLLDLDQREAVAVCVVQNDRCHSRTREWVSDLNRTQLAGLPPHIPHPTHPHVRAAQLTNERAAELVADPTKETSWYVLRAAAKRMKTPIWKLEPKPEWKPPIVERIAPTPLAPRFSSPPFARPLGPLKSEVAPLGISGHYGLPVEGYVRAVEAGINCLFWEPNYVSMNDFSQRLSSTDRNALRFTAGTFEATGERIRRDVDRALRVLKIDRLAVFLMFWVQSWERINEDVQSTLESLQDAGKIASFGLSTHVRPLAVEAIRSGWNPVMVRHSAAHRGAEVEVFPTAVATGTTLITFNNTCYGRLLRPFEGHTALSAADCYRFSLSHQGVAMCWTAPATVDQLDENLAVLRDLTLPEDRRREVETFGAALYREERLFQQLVRGV